KLKLSFIFSLQAGINDGESLPGPQLQAVRSIPIIALTADALVETGNRIRRFATRDFDREFPR
ncbi:MAG TPA: hypothetical protein VGD41_11070, partial [Pyrinomonadaceae bacterium]